MKISENFFKFYELYMSVMGIAGHSLFVFQTLRICSTQSSRDVSLIGFFVAFISIASWLIYGILKKDVVLIRVNIFGFIAALVCIIAIIFNR